MAGEDADELSPSDYETLAAFRYALRRFAAFSSAAAQQAGLTTHQHQALLAIKGHAGPGTLTVGVLAEQLLIAPHTAAELVGRLEGAGLVVKREDSGDRRRVALALTAQAEAALRRLTFVHRREILEMTPRLRTLLGELEAASGKRRDDTR